MSDEELSDFPSSDGSDKGSDVEEDGGGEDDDVDVLEEDLDDNGGSRGGGRSSCAAFDVYSSAAVDELIAGRVSDVCALLALEPTTALALLQTNNFNEEKVTAAVLQDRGAALAAVGITDTAGSNPAKKKSKAASFDCSVCFETVATEQGLALSACGHLFCRACWTEHLRARLAEGGRTAAMASCVWQGCKAIVPSGVWEALMHPRELARYQAAVRDEFALHVFKDYKPCPKEECSNVVHWHSKVNVPVTCLCTFRFCYACHDEATGDHAPASCEEVQLWMKKFSSESENLLFIRAHTRMCPKCRSPIEKNGGCMHMTCRKCKHEFCWICFADWRTHKQCDAQKPEVKSREASEQSAKTELERFEYYMHRWESHKKAADIARRDNTNIADLEAYFSATFGVRTADVNFLNPTLSTLMGGRLMLSWSYVREFYTENKRISQVEKNMWTFGLQELETYTDQLQECYEKGKNIAAGQVLEFNKWKQETVTRTRVARSSFDNFVNGVIKGTLVRPGGNNNNNVEALSEAERFYSVQLEQLAAMGFRDTERIIELLEAHGGNLEAVANRLVK